MLYAVFGDSFIQKSGMRVGGSSLFRSEGGFHVFECAFEVGGLGEVVPCPGDLVVPDGVVIFEKCGYEFCHIEGASGLDVVQCFGVYYIDAGIDMEVEAGFFAYGGDGIALDFEDPVGHGEGILAHCYGDPVIGGLMVLEQLVVVEVGYDISVG